MEADFKKVILKGILRLDDPSFEKFKEDYKGKQQTPFDTSSLFAFDDLPVKMFIDSSKPHVLVKARDMDDCIVFYHVVDQFFVLVD